MEEFGHAHIFLSNIVEMYQHGSIACPERSVVAAVENPWCGASTYKHGLVVKFLDIKVLKTA